MKYRDFYEVLCDNTAFLGFFQGIGLIPDHDSMKCCSKAMKLRIKKKRRGELFFVLCTTCKKEISLFKDTFFNCTDKTGKCKFFPKQILEFLFFWTNKLKYSVIKKQLGWRLQTIQSWSSYTREKISDFIRRQPRLGGQGCRVHLDEVRLLRFEDHMGHMLLGDVEAPIWARRSKYKGLVEGPWVFGMVCQNGLAINERRYSSRLFVVDRRDESTLLPIIQSNIEPGSRIWSDDIPAYVHIRDFGYDHKTVILKENVSNPFTDATTRLMDKFWIELKSLLIHHKKQTSCNGLLKSYFDEFSFRKQISERDLFLSLLHIL